MTDSPTPLISTSGDTPLATFSRCHLGIVRQLEETAQLPGWIDAAAHARSTAAKTLELFRDAVIPHHREEEAELFPAVLKSASPQELAKVKGLVEKLTDEHAHIESLWKKLEPSVRAAARGAPSDLDGEIMSDLVHMYLQHARFEETDFLPLAEEILGRNGNHMAALGVSLHMRHQKTVPGYI